METEKISVLLIEDVKSEAVAIEDYFKKSEDFQIIGTASGENDALSLTRELLPQAVILDLELNQGSGLGYLDKLSKMGIKKPYILATTHVTSPTVHSCIEGIGVDFTLYKTLLDYSPKTVLEALLPIKKYIKYFHSQDAVPKTPVMTEQAVKDLITHDMNRIGITTKVSGRFLLTDMIFLAAKLDIRRIDITNDIYLPIAKMYATSPDNVKHKTATAIQSAWNKGIYSKAQAILYTQSVDSSRGNPTNREFIIYYAEKYKKSFNL